MDWNTDLKGWLAALGIGLLIGVVRERHNLAAKTSAGLRTHAVVALAAAVATQLGLVVLAVMLLALGGLLVASYLRGQQEGPGLTSEVALLLTALLAAFAQYQPAMAAALAVVAAILLQAKRPLHRLAREVISEGEIRDMLLLAAAALVVLPLLPDRAIDPWGALRPAMLWRLVVLVLAVGMLGHVALRAVGARWGLPVAGFFAGFASSTAAVAGFGGRVRENPGLRTSAVAAALLANLASLLLFAAILGAVAPELLRAMSVPLAAAAMVLLVGGALGVHRAGSDAQLPAEPPARAFHLSHALLLAAVIAAMLLVSAWMRQLFGDTGALVASTVAAFAELRAAGATLAQLAADGGLQPMYANWGVLALLAAASTAKSILAFVSGGAAYGVRVAAGLWLSMIAAVVAMWLLVV